MKRNIFYVLLIVGLCLSSLGRFSSVRGNAAYSDKISPWVLDATADGARTDFLVALNEQADLSGAYHLLTKQAKGSFVRDALWDTAQRTQAPLRAWLDARNVPYRSFYIVNLLHIQSGDRALVETLAARSDVARIEANPRIRNVEPQPMAYPDLSAPQAIEWNITKVSAPGVWALGYTGQGIVVGGQDTGYDWDHPALKNQYRGWDGAASHDYNWHDSIHSGGGSCGANSPEPCDDYGHGTHTMGTAVGSDGASNQIGMAPGARWIGCRNMNQGVGTPATYLECFEFFLAPYPVNGNPAQGRPELAPDVTNNSWGCPTSEGCSWNTLQAAVEAQRAAGIMTVVSAGNSGSGCSTVEDPPSIYDTSYTVGATDSLDALAGFSSRGPVTVDGSNRPKPDISAPGVNIRSSVPGGGYQGGWEGTSMAAPHVAGAVALLWSAVPGLTNDIAATEAYLNASAFHISSTSCSSSGVPNNLYGWGRLNVYDALQAAIGDAGVLAGRVTEAAPPGDPVAKATIWASRSPTMTARLSSGADGLYVAYMVPGIYTLTVTAEGYITRTISGVEVETGLTTTLNITLSTTPHYAVVGTVTEAGSGAPLTATVSVEGSAEPPVNTDPSTGAYTMSLPAGVYTLLAEASAHAPQSRVITVTGPLTEHFALASICLLVVDDDASANYQTFYLDALDNAGVAYDVHTVPAGADGPGGAAMSAYNGVIWFTGNDGSTALKANDRDNLASYLDGGGRLFLSGQDIAYNIRSTSFLTDYLHAHFDSDDANNTDLVGLEWMGGRNVAIQGGDGADNQTWPDDIAPVNGGVAVYDYPTDPDDLYGGVAYSNDYRTVFFSFGYEAINNQTDRDDVMESVLGYLGVCGKTLPVMPPMPGFTSSSPDVIGTATIFTNTSTGAEPITYTWDFGDEGQAVIQPSEQFTLTYVYAAVGEYTVWLTATNAGGSAAVSGTVEITGRAPSAGFVSSSPVELGEVMVFTNTSEAGEPEATAYVWAFGDGVTSTLEHPTHTYTIVDTRTLVLTSTTYTVWLRASNPAGSDVFSDVVKILIPPVSRQYQIYLPMVLKNN